MGEGIKDQPFIGGRNLKGRKEIELMIFVDDGWKNLNKKREKIKEGTFMKAGRVFI